MDLFALLMATEHEFLTAHKSKMLKNEDTSCFKTLRCCIYLANKMLKCHHFLHLFTR